ncbi:MAG: hypothetical protein LBU22_10260 [Dysgonamonadaceae bacterium]|jgi:hypothetical protein|nr:hypothetical protein [Dysgonamonadaceae bacterium]
MKKIVISVAILFVMGVSVFAQYPKITQEVEAQSNELLRKAQESSDVAFAKVLPKDSYKKGIINGIDPAKKVDWTNPNNNKDTLLGKKNLL